ILDNIIDSQTAFFQEKKYDLFDPHPEESCCQIRAVNLLLRETYSSKPKVEFNYQVDYLRRMKSIIADKILYFTDQKQHSFFTLNEFLKKHELVLLINLVDQYIFVCYFLTHFKSDYKKVAAIQKINTGVSKELVVHYQKIMTLLSRDVIILVASDISNRKKSETALHIAKKEAESANRAKTEFLENMRHDIRTPLSGIIGFARLIQKEAISARTKDYADNLVLATNALLDFQNEILDAIKVNKNDEPVAQEVFDLKKLVEKVLNLVRPKAIVKKLTLSFFAGADLPEFVRGDPKRLFRILLELLSNSLKFTAEGGIQINLLALKINPEQFTLRCEIVDSGIGIPENKQDKVFIRFHRLTSAADGVYEGSGLGLTIVKKFIKELHGKIKLESVVGKGTTFIFSIPLFIAARKAIGDQRSEISVSMQTPIPDPQSSHILLVEDHAMTATVNELLLQELNCTVDVAFDAKTALVKLKNKKYDLILMDLGLPDCDGFALAKKMKNQRVPIIALTAHREEGVESRCRLSGIADIFQKPLLKSTAIEILNRYLSGDKMEHLIIDLSLGAKRIGKD
ncbi:MAG: ATP-binding protein, partial [Gammaproteobacteria bacterium]|nr:ATP-binding protein [Gammaproteobacteria bacterium]